jgi:hypothetical protein
MLVAADGIIWRPMALFLVRIDAPNQSANQKNQAVYAFN